jgi:hypothetical protein
MSKISELSNEDIDVIFPLEQELNEYINGNKITEIKKGGFLRFILVGN